MKITKWDIVDELATKEDIVGYLRVAFESGNEEDIFCAIDDAAKAIKAHGLSSDNEQTDNEQTDNEQTDNEQNYLDVADSIRAFEHFQQFRHEGTKDRNWKAEILQSKTELCRE